MNKKEYLLAFPGYVHFCGGIVTGHYLCSRLNERGYPAYITGSYMNPQYHTLSVNSLSQEKLRDLQHNGIIIYPDIVPNNPCRFTNCIKFWLGGSQPTPPNQMSWVFSKAHQVPGCEADNVFYFPPEIEPFFREPDVENRHGIAAYSGKGQGMGLYPVPETGSFSNPAPGVTVIQAGFPPTRQGVAELLQRSEVFYCYDNMCVMIVEARLCGCPVIVCGYLMLSKENFDKVDYSNLGLGRYDEKPDIKKLKAEIPQFREEYAKRRKQMDVDLDMFIEKTQAWNPNGVYVEDPHPTDPNAHMIYGHRNFDLFRTR